MALAVFWYQNACIPIILSEMKSHCFCLTIEDFPHPLRILQGATAVMDTLPPSPWKAEPVSSLKKHRIHHHYPPWYGASEIEKPSVEVKATCKPRIGAPLWSTKKDAERPTKGASFSHLAPSEYILAYRTAHASGIAGTNISTKQDTQEQPGNVQQKHRYVRYLTCNKNVNVITVCCVR